MILSNYWKHVQFTLCDVGSVSAKDYGFVDTSGSTVGAILVIPNGSNYSDANFYPKARLRNFENLILGDGTGIVQPTDYALFHPNTSQWSNVNWSMSSAPDDDGFISIITITGQNHTGTTNQITEFGLSKSFIASSGSSATPQILMIKVVLEEPVVVPNGGSFQIVADWVQS